MQKSVFQMLLDVKTRGENNIRRLGRDLQGVQGQAKNLTSSFGGLSKSLLALAGIGGGAALITGIFGSAAELESQTRSLEVLTGSAEKTKQIVAEIKAFGAATPFQVSELIDVTKQLKAFGIETESLVDTTKRLGDVSGATGADLEGIATAFGQISAKGKFAQEENLQLLERGVDLTTELKEMYGLSGDELAKAMSKGQISFEAANQALIRLTNEGGQYFGGAIAQADTLNGKLSTLQDAFVTLGQNIGKVLEPLFKGLLDFVTLLTNKLNSLFAEADITNQAMQNLGFDKLTRAQLQKRPEFKSDLEAEKQRLRTEAATAKLTETVQFTPALLVSSTSDSTVQKAKEAVQVSDEVLELTKQVNAADLEGNRLKEVDLRYELELQKLQESGLEGNNLELKQNDLLTQYTKDRLAVVQELGEEYEKNNNTLTETQIILQDIGNSIKSSIVDGLSQAIIYGESLNDVLSSVLNTAAELFLNFGITSLFPFLAPTTNAKGNVFAQNKVVPFAYGGVVNKPTLFPMANGMGLMGEAGPEAIMPLRRGRGGRLGVEASGGTGNVVVNVDASGSTVKGDAGSAKQLGNAIGAAVQAELIKQRRPGGLLAS